MVKRRELKLPLKKEPTEAQIEAFANGVNGTTQDRQKEDVSLDKNAPRKFKTISVPFNEYEYEQLLKGSNLSSRSKLNFVRYAMLKLSEELQE